MASILASTLAKLALRAFEISPNETFKNALRAEAMLIMISVIRVGESSIVSNKIDEDTVDRIFTCVKIVGEGYQNKQLDKAILYDGRKAFQTQVSTRERQRTESSANERTRNASQVDENLVFRQFAPLATVSDGDVQEGVDQDLVLASGASIDTSSHQSMSKLSKIVQLTDYSDLVYVEAYVNVHQFDIVLDILVFNQTPETL